MGNNMILTTIDIGEKYTYFLPNRWNYTKKDRFGETTLLIKTEKSLDPFDFHVLRCGENVFKEKEHNLIHPYYADQDEDEHENANI